MKVVVIGNGMVGQRFLEQLVKRGGEFEITAFCEEPRPAYDRVQLTSYFNGYAEITALRDEMRAKQGSAFTVKGFNNRFLSYGNAPVRLIRELMIASP